MTSQILFPDQLSLYESHFHVFENAIQHTYFCYRHIPIFSESMDMGFYLSFDNSNKISGLRISNYAPNESRGLSYASLGNDTLKTEDLRNFDQLQGDFAADSGKVRFIVLLSPT